MNVTCPKCGFLSSDPENCPKCGVNFAGYNKYFAHRANNTSSAVTNKLGLKLDFLNALTTIFVKQHEDALRLVTGCQTRNNYSLEDSSGQVLGYIGERDDGAMGFLSRQFFRNRRTLNIDIFNSAGEHVAEIYRPWYFWFSDLYLKAPGHSTQIGRVERKFSFFIPKYDLYEMSGRPFGNLRASFFAGDTIGRSLLGDSRYRLFDREERDTSASILRSWNGVMGLFTDEDTYCVEFTERLSTMQKLVLLAAAIAIDFDSYENDKSLIGPASSIVGGMIGESSSRDWSNDS